MVAFGISGSSNAKVRYHYSYPTFCVVAVCSLFVFVVFVLFFCFSCFFIGWIGGGPQCSRSQLKILY